MFNVHRAVDLFSQLQVINFDKDKDVLNFPLKDLKIFKLKIFRSSRDYKKRYYYLASKLSLE